MSSEVLYRKWRPQTLGEVVGQETVTTTLRNAVRGNRVGHAYLFCGPRGTGKTSTGRILAKAVNCQNPVGGEPCNTCSACVSISEGRCLDVIEIDAASNRGVDDIRQLRERVHYASGTVTRKVYIVDEVHMLTDVASNALLKTLEEPPSHVIFILATTEFHKVLPTIVSRCQTFHFRRLALNAIAAKLRHVCEREGIGLEDESLSAVARAAGGSLRDAENLLQQLIASHGRDLSPAEVRAVLGIADESYVIGLIGELVSADMAAGLRLLHRANDDGVDMRHFSQQMVASLRDLLLVKTGCEDIVEGGMERIEALKRAGGHANERLIVAAVRRFAESNTRDRSQPLLSLELAFVDCVLPQTDAPPAQTEVTANASPHKGTKKSVEMGTDRVPGRKRAGVSTARREDVTTAEDEPGTTSSAVIEAHEASPTDPAVAQEGAYVAQETGTSETSWQPPAQEVVDDGDGLATQEPSMAEGHVEEDPGELGQVRARWREYVDSLRGLGSTGNLDAFLRSACEPVSLDDDVLVLRFAHEFHKSKVEDPKYRHVIEERLLQFFGRPYRVECVLESVQHNGATPSGTAKAEGGLVDAAIRLGARPRYRR